MTGGPAVSVVIPVWNCEAWIRRCVDSVRSQTFAEFELLIVDDGSTDGSPEIADTLSSEDPRIRVVKRAHRGLSATRNAGIRASQSPLVAFLDADDGWYPTKLERQVEFLTGHPECGGTFSWFELVDVNDRLIVGWEQLAERFERCQVDALSLVVVGNQVAGSGSSVMLRRDALQTVGLFDERMGAAEDLDLWYRVALKYEIRATPQVLVQVRERPGNMQSQRERVLRGTQRFCRNVQAMGPASHAAAASRREAFVAWELAKLMARRGRPAEAVRVLLEQSRRQAGPLLHAVWMDAVRRARPARGFQGS